jgi:hypothetical protein
LGDETGHEHINSSVSEEESSEHLEAFENQDNIRAEIDAHKAVTREQVKEIISTSKEINKANKEILEEIEAFKKSDKEVIAALNDTQNNFSLEEIHALSREIDTLSSTINDIRSEFSATEILEEIKGDFLDLSDLSELGRLDINDCNLDELDFDSLELNDLDFEDLDFSGAEVGSKITGQIQESEATTNKL